MKNAVACFLAITAICLTGVAALAETPVSVMLADIDSGSPSPQGNYRWLDVADQAYAAAYRDGYDYTQATVQADFFTGADALHGTLTAGNLKPHFAYQLKLVGTPGTDANERIGLTGRWWQEEWNGSAWANGSNLNNKGDGSSPSPNDDTYFARRDVPDATSPTGKHYRYTGYLLLDYFTTDSFGNAILSFVADSSYHVLWKTSQRARTSQDGPLKTAAFDVSLPDPVSAYDVDYPGGSESLFGEWERLPVGGVPLPPGDYEGEIVLTEESFHGGGLAGGWAGAMSATATFYLGPEPVPALPGRGIALFLLLAAAAGLVMERRRWAEENGRPRRRTGARPLTRREQ